MRWQEVAGQVVAALLVACIVALAVAALAWSLGVMADAVGALS